MVGGLDYMILDDSHKGMPKILNIQVEGTCLEFNVKNIIYKTVNLTTYKTHLI